MFPEHLLLLDRILCLFVQVPTGRTGAVPRKTSIFRIANSTGMVVGFKGRGTVTLCFIQVQLFLVSINHKAACLSVTLIVRLPFFFSLCDSLLVSP